MPEGISPLKVSDVVVPGVPAEYKHVVFDATQPEALIVELEDRLSQIE